MIFITRTVNINLKNKLFYNESRRKICIYNSKMKKHSYKTCSILGSKKNLNAINRNSMICSNFHVPSYWILRSYSDNFGIAWKKTTIKAKTNESEQRKNIAHLVVNKSIDSDITISLNEYEIKRLISSFINDSNVKEEARTYGMNEKVFLSTFISFRKLCLESKILPTDLYETLKSIKNGISKPIDLLPYMLNHSMKINPHLEIIKELNEISDCLSPEKM